MSNKVYNILYLCKPKFETTRGYSDSIIQLCTVQKTLDRAPSTISNNVLNYKILANKNIMKVVTVTFFEEKNK